MFKAATIPVSLPLRGGRRADTYNTEPPPPQHPKPEGIGSSGERAGGHVYAAHQESRRKPENCTDRKYNTRNKKNK